jgi:hypothetical protein
LGEFLDELKAAQKAKEDRIEAERRNVGAERQAVEDKVKAATDWVDQVLGPVTLEVNEDISSVGSLANGGTNRRDIADQPPKVVKQVVVDIREYKPKTLMFQIQDGAIDVYADESGPERLGMITTTSRDHVKGLFRRTIKSIVET